MTMPLDAVIIPRVAMNGGTLPSCITIPLMTPRTVQARSATTMERNMPIPLCISMAERMLATPRTDPTERSMPPEMITKVIPRATMPVMDVCLTRFLMLLKVMKFGVAIVRKMIITRMIRIRLPSAILVLFRFFRILFMFRSMSI